MASNEEPGWLLGLRAALRKAEIRSNQTGPAAARIAQDWIKSYQVMLTKVPEDSLLSVYQRLNAHSSLQEAEAIAAEIGRRCLDF